MVKHLLRFQTQELGLISLKVISVTSYTNNQVLSHLFLLQVKDGKFSKAFIYNYNCFVWGLYFGLKIRNLKRKFGLPYPWTWRGLNLKNSAILPAHFARAQLKRQ